MGKKYCDIGEKWCKFLRHNLCDKAKCSIKDIGKCPRLVEIETISLYDLLKEVNFESVFKVLCQWYDDQERNKEGYLNVFNTLLSMTPLKHNLSDLFINIESINEDGEEWLYVNGVNIYNKHHYGIEFESWNKWISMFITQKSLDIFPKEDIVAGCLYEMTFHGFNENTVIETKEKLFNICKEAKNQLKNNKND